jgi:cephalosporin hydroxylase
VKVNTNGRSEPKSSGSSGLDPQGENGTDRAPGVATTPGSTASERPRGSFQGTLKGVGFRAIDVLTPAVVRAFHYVYYTNARTTWWNTWWFGHRTLKTPFDLWVYQEIMFEVRPDLIIETGTARGGSALFLASMCDLLGAGRVVTIDLEEWSGRPTHDRIRYVQGSSIDAKTVELVAEEVAGSKSSMVILDSAHDAAHVSKELELYAPMVTPGSYLLVEDTNLNGHPIKRKYGSGPWEAVEAFLQRHPEFSQDRSREKFLFTFNPRGFLRRVPD